MKRTSFLGIALALIAGLGPTQTYHDVAYVIGGHPGSGPVHRAIYPGLYVVKGDGTHSTIALPGFNTHSFCMDVDNQHIVALVQGTTSTLYSGPMYGLYRFDPRTMACTTIRGPDTVNLNMASELHINQDGDYIVNGGTRNGTRLDYQVMKIDPNGNLTTLLTSYRLGRSARLVGAMSTNISNGKLLIAETTGVNPTFPVLELAPDGTVSTFNDGSVYGWGIASLYHCEQNVSNGCLEGPYFNTMYQLKRGSSGRTTLSTISYGNLGARLFNGRYDLQTAPQTRWVATGKNPGVVWEQGIAYIAPSGRATSIRTWSVGVGQSIMDYDFDFYRGRHIQTLKTGTDRWDILLSCPRSPGRNYVLAASLSGVRPGVPLPDGRRINLVLDHLTAATINNWLPGIWNAGPGKLNAIGAARGVLDLSTLGRPPRGFGIPVWFSLIVLDPNAPFGIKYVPDTYVMRI